MKTVLFYGDSITDGNRYKDEKDRGDLNHQMGHSYAYVINALLGSRYPEKNLHFLNRGISGNRVLELYGRFYEDVVALKPDVVSILVGVNDGPQAEHGRHATGREAYGKIYRMMLKEIKAALPEVKFILCEPFLGKRGPVYDTDTKAWQNCIREYQEEVRIIDEYKSIMSGITPIVFEKLQSWVLGSGNIEAEYDDFVNELKARNIDRAIEIQQEAYDNFMKVTK